MNVTNITSINHTAHLESREGGGGRAVEGDKESERQAQRERERES